MQIRVAFPIAAAVLLGAALSACECGRCRKGFSCYQMVVTVHDGVTRQQVDRMNSEIDAQVIDSAGNFYIIRLPEHVDACEAMDFYEDRPEVNSALPDSEVSVR